MFKKTQTVPQQSPPPPTAAAADKVTEEKQDSPIFDRSNPFNMSTITTVDVHAEPIPLTVSSSQSNDDKTLSINIDTETWI